MIFTGKVRYKAGNMWYVTDAGEEERLTPIERIEKLERNMIEMQIYFKLIAAGITLIGVGVISLIVGLLLK